MPKYVVHLQRWMEQTASLTVEAESIEAAVDAAHETAKTDYADIAVKWSEGGEVIQGAAAEIDYRMAYSAMGLDNDETWERE